MESWLKEQLDKETVGEIALALFKKQEEVSKAASWRAEMASAMSYARDELEKREKAFSDACSNERFLVNEATELSKYLKKRVNYE